MFRNGQILWQIGVGMHMCQGRNSLYTDLATKNKRDTKVGKTND